MKRPTATTWKATAIPSMVNMVTLHNIFSIKAGNRTRGRMRTSDVFGLIQMKINYF